MISAVIIALSLQVGQGAYIVSARPAPQDRRTATTSESSTGTDSSPVSTRPVCRMEQVTGTRFPIRVCRSPRTAQNERNETRDMLRDAQGLPELGVNRGHQPPGR